MSRSNDCWGIELGSHALKAVRLVANGPNIELAEYDVLPYNEVLSTPDLDVEEAVKVNLDKFLSRHEVRRRGVYVSVPGNMAFARFAKLPPVEPKKIPDIVKFEAVQQIPFPIDQVEWDYQVFAQDDAPDVEVGIFALTKERASNFMTPFRDLGVEVDGLTLSPLAVYNAMWHDLEMTPSSEGVIFMDIGTNSTDIIVVEEGRIWLRTLPIGGNNFTEALVRSFKLSFQKAEKLKCEAGQSKYARQIFQAMRPVFSDLVQDVQRSLGFYQTINRDANLTRMIGLGSTFRLPGLHKFLKQQLQIEVDQPRAADGVKAGFRRIAPEGEQGNQFGDQSLNLATAYGLALQGLGEARVNANILPTEIVMNRLQRRKQPIMVAATAVAVVAAAVPCVFMLMAINSQREPRKANDPQVQRVMKDANAFVSDFNKAAEEKDKRQEIENYFRTLLYRDLWVDVVTDVGGAVASLNSSPDLFGPPDEVGKIPRDQRKRMYITSMKSQYSPTKVDLITAYTVPGAAKDANVPGMLIVTLEGYTPYRDGIPMLNSFIAALNQKEANPGKPYRLISSLKAITVRERGLSGAAAARPGAAATPAAGGRPLAHEDNKEDLLFRIQFLVDILAPDPASQALVRDYAVEGETSSPAEKQPPQKSEKPPVMPGAVALDQENHR